MISSIDHSTLAMPSIFIEEKDPNSFSNVNDIHTTHISIEWIVNFERRCLDGTVTLTLVPKKKTVDKIILDTRDLFIQSVIVDDSVEANFTVEPSQKTFGSALIIPLNEDMCKPEKGKKLKVKIKYQTSSQCTAAQWLNSEQTVGKKYPYLFTQCQAIHARSLLPCQDTPSVKITYDAIVRVPNPLIALMSAINVDQIYGLGSDAQFLFEQKISVPTYLIALAVGNIKGKIIGRRSTVWSEPEILEACANEFVETEKFIETAEELLTPYEWKKYDLLVLPCSFPYGGMENPCLTFVTPTLLAGDRSLVDVVAHEIAHSWTGNLVTSANWQHFWLNEGFTMFIERKILGRVHGESFRQFSSWMGVNNLKESIQHLGSTNHLTALVPNLENTDPDDAFSSVPYEKGYTFLYFLEEKVGGPIVFEPFLKEYVKHFAHHSITTDHFKDFFDDYFRKKEITGIEWSKWFDSPGMPIYIPNYSQDLVQSCRSLAEKWNGTNLPGSKEEYDKLSTLQKVFFLETLTEKAPLSHSVIEMMAHLYDLNQVKNCEIRHNWLLLCLKSHYEECFDQVKDFVSSQGRMKYVRPLYRAWKASSEIGAIRAAEAFKELKSFYHPIASQMIEQDLK